MKKNKTAKRSLRSGVIVSEMLTGVWKAFLIISLIVCYSGNMAFAHQQDTAIYQKAVYKLQFFLRKGGR